MFLIEPGGKITGSCVGFDRAELDAMARELRRAGKTVAIIAVDPSSRMTGRAILPDRILMQRHHAGSRFFNPPIVSRAPTGRLAPATATMEAPLPPAPTPINRMYTVCAGNR